MQTYDLISLFCIVLGTFFFVAGLVGLIRFPDFFTRLHALTKADNLGLGLIIVGIGFHTLDFLLFLKLIIVWLFFMFSGAACSFINAETKIKKEQKGEKRP